jgi:hypothetical protein
VSRWRSRRPPRHIVMKGVPDSSRASASWTSGRRAVSARGGA